MIFIDGISACCSSLLVSLMASLCLQFIKILLILLDVVLVLAKTRQGTSAINGMR